MTLKSDADVRKKIVRFREILVKHKIRLRTFIYYMSE